MIFSGYLSEVIMIDSVSGFHGGKYEDDSFLGYDTM
jgi:hypothetical protein